MMSIEKARPTNGAQARSASALFITITTILLAVSLLGCGDDPAKCFNGWDSESGQAQMVCTDDYLSSEPNPACGTVFTDDTGRHCHLLCGAEAEPIAVCDGKNGVDGVDGKDGANGTGTGGTGGGAVTPYQLCNFAAPPAANDPNAYLAVSDAYADGSTDGLWSCQTLKLSTSVSTSAATVVYNHGNCAETVKVTGSVSGAVSWDVGHATFSGATGQPTYADFGSPGGCAVAFGGANATVAVIPFMTD